MSTEIPVEYHEATLALLGVEPHVSNAATEAIAEREKAAGSLFPASVKAWFYLEDAKRMFDETGNHLESRDELGWPDETRRGR